jgi:hypothetical protein
LYSLPFISPFFTVFSLAMELVDASAMAKLIDLVREVDFSLFSRILPFLILSLSL